MILLSAQGMAVPKIAEVSFTSANRVRDVIHNFGHRRLRLALPEVRRWPAEEVHPARTPRDQEDRQVHPVEHGLPFSTWSLTKLAEFLVAEGVIDDISHEGLPHPPAAALQGTSVQPASTGHATH
nr:hypothetical protein [Rhodococcus sp. 14C212]